MTDTYTPDRSHPVIVQIRDAAEFLTGLRKATGSLTMNSVPDNSDTIIISDGVTARTYTFKTTLTGAAREVLRGTITSTATALAAAINVDAPPGATDRVAGIIATNPSAGVVNLTNTVVGTAGNVPITGTGAPHFTVVGMSGGALGGA